MGKKLIGIAIIAIMLFGVFGLAGCNGKHKIQEEGYFQYIVVDENTRYAPQQEPCIAIVGLTELGKQQGVLDFPKAIAGKEVKFIGYRRSDTFMSSYYHLESPNLKKSVFMIT